MGTILWALIIGYSIYKIYEFYILYKWKKTGKRLEILSPSIIILGIITISSFIVSVCLIFKSEQKLKNEEISLTLKELKQINCSEFPLEFSQDINIQFKKNQTKQILLYKFELCNNSSINFGRKHFDYGRPIEIKFKADPLINELEINDDQYTTGFKKDSVFVTAGFVSFLLSFNIFNSKEKVIIFAVRSENLANSIYFDGRFEGMTNFKFYDNIEIDYLRKIKAWGKFIIICLLIFLFMGVNNGYFKPMKLALKEGFSEKEFQFWNELPMPIKLIYINDPVDLPPFS